MSFKNTKRRMDKLEFLIRCLMFLQLDAGHAKQGKKCIRITRSFIVHLRHALFGWWWWRVNVCNHRVAKQSKAGPTGAESSCGESTMLSANFGEAIRGKQAVKNCFLFVCGPRFRDLRLKWGDEGFWRRPRRHVILKYEDECWPVFKTWRTR